MQAPAMTDASERPLPSGEDAVPEREIVAESGGLVARLHGQLHQMLLTHEIPLGQPISERHLSVQLGVSRTPLREALRRLEGEGFIERRNGVLEVKRIVLEEFVDLLKIRRLLEGDAAASAAGMIPFETIEALRIRLTTLLASDSPANRQRIELDLELHRAVCDNCGNRSMAEMIEQLRRKSMLFIRPPAPQDFREAIKEHMRLLDALAAGDAEQARAAMADHIDNVLKKVFSRLLQR
jgi:DNA-binding GntR family transcriptional regulator